MSLTALHIEDWLVYFLPFVVIILAGWLLYRIIIDQSNPIEWWHFISSVNPSTGTSWGDIDKLGKSIALLTSSIAILWMAYQSKLDWELLFVYLSFAGAIGAWSAYLRSKQAMQSQPVPPDQPAKP